MDPRSGYHHNLDNGFQLYKANGHVEAEVGATKRAIRTMISPGLCPLDFWPLAACHMGERRLRAQLQRVGWPAAPMLQFGSNMPSESLGKSDMPICPVEGCTGRSHHHGP